MRVALYARYSSDNQSAASIADQLRICRERAAREGWIVAASFEDAAISGASLMRPGFQALMREALAGAFDVVLAESLDRFSRDQEDTAALFKRLTFAGVRIVTLAEGDIGHLHIGFKGTMNALYLTDLAEKTRRGLRGRVEAGKSGGGLCYGYRVLRAQDDQPGDREIHPGEAAIVQRIFRAFVDGASPKAIAKQLNAERVAGPEGRPWGHTTIRGHVQRGTGILNNELYVGRLVWNRLRYLKDPETGRRRSRLNPSSAWITADVPQLRIVDDELWQAAKARQAVTARALASGVRFNRLTRPRHLLSGLLWCEACGSRYVVITKDRFGCSAARNKGTCDNRFRISHADIERRVLRVLREDLLDPKLFADFCIAFTAGVNHVRRQQRAAAAEARRDMATVERHIRAIVDAVKNGFASKAMAAELAVLELRQEKLARALDVQDLPTLHPNMADVYRERVTALAEGLAAPETATAAAEQIRALVKRITIARDGAALVHGDLALMLRLAQGLKAGADVSGLSADTLTRTIEVVAGARNGLYRPLFERTARCA